MVRLPFADRLDAAAQLAPQLEHLRRAHPLVLAIPRGAVPMGRELARRLNCDFDVVMVRKLGAPGNPEFAVGAVDEAGHAWIAPHARDAGADERYLSHTIAEQRRTMRERRQRWSPGRTPTEVAGRTVIVVDDGLATGATMRVALDAVRRRGPKRLVCAVPVAAPDSLETMRPHCDEVVCLHAPTNFHAVGAWYHRFDPVDDDEVARCLAEPAAAGERAIPLATAVHIPLADAVLEADLVLPPDPRGLVLFAHGSGSSRHSPRNRQVSAVLQQGGFATLLPDLLTAAEDRVPANRFDIALLSRRLYGALDWARQHPILRELPIGLFGASTGAASAIEVAAHEPFAVSAVVSRGGRPDLASETALARLHAPTLLLVGSADHEVLALNRAALGAMPANATLTLVRGATHLFEEPGALEQVARHATDWFERWLGAPRAEQR